jgi:Carboxypeptidase regulatory-like domain
VKEARATMKIMRRKNPSSGRAVGDSFVPGDRTSAERLLRGRALGLALVLLAACLAAGAAQFAWAKKHETRLRTVRGTVVDKAENPLATAIVYLKNRKTLSVRTYITDKTGHYRFSGLDPNVDYEVHAEHGDSSSATRTISSLDDNKDIVIVLKVREKKRRQ